MQRIYIYTGNHGHSAGITDIVTMVRNGARDCGYDAVVSHEPVAGEWNILIENFRDEPNRNFIRSRWTPETRYIIVCTELISPGGFNVGLGANDGHYGNSVYWQERYRGFLEIASLSQELWVLHDGVIADYQKAFPDKRISFLRHGWVSDMSHVRHRPEHEKDIDFFFSGTLTPSRLAILQQLSGSHRVAALQGVSCHAAHTAEFAAVDLAPAPPHPQPKFRDPAGLQRELHSRPVRADCADRGVHRLGSRSAEHSQPA
jgi:hypothetical protein